MCRLANGQARSWWWMAGFASQPNTPTQPADVFALLMESSDQPFPYLTFKGPTVYTMTEYLFSYGTLQQADVQTRLFGRLLQGEPDTLPGYRVVPIEIRDEAF